MTLLIIVAYGLAMIVTACRLASLMAWRSFTHDKKENASWVKHRDEPSGGMWAGFGILAFAISVAWPVVVLIAALRGPLLKPPAFVMAERNAKRVKELERELEIA